MMYFIIRETYINDSWYYSFIGIKEIENIPTGFIYDNYFKFYSKIIESDLNNDYENQIILLSIYDLYEYIDKSDLYMRKDNWDKYFIEYLKTHHPEIYLMIATYNL